MLVFESREGHFSKNLKVHIPKLFNNMLTNIKGNRDKYKLKDLLNVYILRQNVDIDRCTYENSMEMAFAKRIVSFEIFFVNILVSDHLSVTYRW